jgi:signal transduction histidine kinase
MSAEPWQRLSELLREAGKASDRSTYLQSILYACVELTNSEAASIMEYDPSTRALHFTAAPWFHQKDLRTLQVPLEGSAAGWVYQTGQTLRLDDAGTDSRHFQGVDNLTRYQTHTLLAVPLMEDGQPFGVLEVLNKQGEAHYTEEDAAIVECLAVFTALAIRNDLLEMQVRYSENELVEFDRLKNDFVAITSHELRTPLGLIIGHASYLRESLDKNLQDQADAILKNANKLKEILETLANVDNYRSGQTRLRNREVAIADILEDVARAFQDMADQKGIALSVGINKDQSRNDAGLTSPEDHLKVDVDAGKIGTALSNLVKNAIIFTDSGGHVRIEADHVPGHVRISVIDDGLGIPSKDLPHIFERFFQAESHLTRRHGGMGLGLSIAKAMVEMHGGKIWVESVAGAGSKFTVLLPSASNQPGDTTPIDR